MAATVSSWRDISRSAAGTSGSRRWSIVGALKGDAAEMAQRWNGENFGRYRAEATAWPSSIVDALFGAGLSRPLEGEARAACAEFSEHSGIRVVAIDVPSGIHGDTAKPLGDAYVRGRTHDHLLPQEAGACA